MTNFWKKLNKPIMALAPMANVTDEAFRRIIAKYGHPDVMWTEFVSADGLMSEGRERLLPDLWFSPEERPIVAQIFGANIENFKKSAELLTQLGFDGIDINMGCPEKNVCKSGAGAALVNDYKLARELIKAVKEGCSNSLPVSVKIRIGYNKNVLDEWLGELIQEEPEAIIIHLRTKKEMSAVDAHWDLLGSAIAKLPEKRPIILGNGDVKSLNEAKKRVQESGADGVMIGRGIFGNPWFFSKETSERTTLEKLKVMVEHTELFTSLYKPNNKENRGIKNFDVMKKHYKAYVSGFDGAKELRVELMNCNNVEEVKNIIERGKYVNNESGIMNNGNVAS